MLIEYINFMQIKVCFHIKFIDPYNAYSQFDIDKTKLSK